MAEKEEIIILDLIECGDTKKLPKDFWLLHWMTFEELYEAVGKCLPKPR